jgi:hypothetical protein
VRNVPSRFFDLPEVDNSHSRALSPAPRRSEAALRLVFQILRAANGSLG